MARTVTEIQNEIFGSITANENLAGLTSQSKVAIYRLIVFVVSFGIWTLETLFDIHKKELQTELLEQKSGTLPWYRTMALAFQYGFDLMPDSDKFNNGTATDEQIEASKIVKYAAVIEGSKDSRVIIKIAGEKGGVLAPITNVQRNAFDTYIDEVRYAGVKVTVINYLPDRLYLTLQIYRDPLLIDASGNSILNGGRPVEKAISEYMKELPFNGELVLAHLIDKLQKVEGVRIPNILAVQSCWIDPTIGGYGTPQPVNVKGIPESGYYEVANFDNITYVV
ncbi:nucleotidyltransferase [Flavobacterium aestivum]|uniref:nucleotidyltransferase n=1 Tax=Flavobacterium aestivum TaxID=3003257 RepID=UPI0024829954|nr:nucleotidyltransferase [Flavobacterium aestivum]